MNYRVISLVSIGISGGLSVRYAASHLMSRGLSCMKKFNRDSWYPPSQPFGDTHVNPWYSIKQGSPYENPNQAVSQATVELYPHKCVGCLRKFKTMKQTQAYCSYACFALGNKSPGGGVIGQPETVTVGILGPTKRKAWHIDKRRKSLSDIKDIQEVLTGD